MAVNEMWYNDDGLQVRSGLEQSGAVRNKFKSNHTDGIVKELVAKVAWNNMPGFDFDKNNDGTLDSFDKNNVYIPVRALVLDARILITTAFLTSSSAVLNIGTYQQDGTAISATGIDAAIAAGGLLIDTAVVCDGAQIGTLMPTYNSYLRVYQTVGTFTAGVATVVVRYMEPLL